MSRSILVLAAALVGALALLAAGPSVAAEETFDHWLSGFKKRARADGHSRALVNATFEGVAPDPKLIELDQSQPEFVRPIWQYLASAVSETRVATGRERAAEEAALLADLELRYGVDRDVIIGIWGLESAYGDIIGDHDIVVALSTLAWEGRRRALFEAELMAVLDILESGYAAREELVGGWAGAFGQTQFMPTTYLAYAVDYDGDGRKDLWADRGDALASAALYLSDKGWTPGAPVLMEVEPPEMFDYALADGRIKTVGGWAEAGLIRSDRHPWGTEQFTDARLLVPAGAGGPAFLTFSNFDVIKRYNNSTAYALGVALLGDAVAGRPGVKAAWPTDVQPLTRSQIKEMQAILTDLGYDTKGIDGIVGPATQAALRAWQTEVGRPADGFATFAVLEMLIMATAH